MTDCQIFLTIIAWVPMFLLIANREIIIDIRDDITGFIFYLPYAVLVAITTSFPLTIIFLVMGKTSCINSFLIFLVFEIFLFITRKFILKFINFFFSLLE